MTIETRFKSKESYEFARRDPNLSTEDMKETTGFLSFRKSRSPVQTIELDEDSFFLAFSEWSSFVTFSLGVYAAAHQDVRASIYTYSTGPVPSVNSSHGELHQRNGWHNACFIGVVGKQKMKILNTIIASLVYQRNVPDEVVIQLLDDASKKQQICCKKSPDYVVFNLDPWWHIEDGCVWRPYESDVWYTDSQWAP